MVGGPRLQVPDTGMASGVKRSRSKSRRRRQSRAKGPDNRGLATFPVDRQLALMHLGEVERMPATLRNGRTHPAGTRPLQHMTRVQPEGRHESHVQDSTLNGASLTLSTAGARTADPARVTSLVRISQSAVSGAYWRPIPPQRLQLYGGWAPHLWKIYKRLRSWRREVQRCQRQSSAFRTSVVGRNVATVRLPSGSVVGGAALSGDQG